MSSQARRSTSDQIVQVLRENDDAFMTASEISDKIGKTRQAVRYQLDNLHDEGRVERKQAGSRAVGWWLTDS
jgi:predicted ArsR family transcriptional regulator